jgi:hypothetical protein
MRQLKYIHSYLHRPVLVVSSASHGRVAGHIVGYYPWPHVVEYEQFAVLAIQVKTLCRSKAEPNMRKKRVHRNFARAGSVRLISGRSVI